jgi:hypothetical protein
VRGKGKEEREKRKGKRGKGKEEREKKIMLTTDYWLLTTFFQEPPCASPL